MEWIFKILLCILLTSIIGYDRKKNGMIVGVRTHVIVGLSAVMLQIISIEAISKGYGGEVFRLGGQMLSGIGFLGAGAIMKNDKTIKGLTTASTIFLVACIGLAVGFGMYMLSIVITAIAYAFLEDIFHIR